MKRSKFSEEQIAYALRQAGRDAGRRCVPPRSITVDHGTEFQSRALEDWAYERGVPLDFIRPGKPVENAFIEAFNGRLRDECLNVHQFASLIDARQKPRRGGSTTIGVGPTARSATCPERVRYAMSGNAGGRSGRRFQLRTVSLWANVIPGACTRSRRCLRERLRLACRRSITGRKARVRPGEADASGCQACEG